MKARNSGLDIFRIMCCIGVLIYHIVDDILDVGGLPAKALYYSASYCVPGFFLLAGYLIGKRDKINFDYCENKVRTATLRLFGWVCFWGVIHFIRTNEILDIWNSFLLGASAKGILPVAWFLFTYDFLIIIAYPLHKLLKSNVKWIIFAGTILWMTAIALGCCNSFVASKPQSLWLHLYLGYFATGMILSEMNIENKNHKMIKVAGSFIVHMIMSVVYWKYIKALGAAPHQHYGSWYYTIWLISMFVFIITAANGNIPIYIKNIIKTIADDTFVIYLGHLPILIYFTTIKPLENLSEAVLSIAGLFVSLVLLAEIFRRLPVLRKIV